MNKQTILYGAGAVIVLYLFFKSEAKAAVQAVTQTASDAYKPVYDASFSFGGWLYDVTHPGAAASRSASGISTVNSTQP